VPGAERERLEDRGCYGAGEAVDLQPGGPAGSSPAPVAEGVRDSSSPRSRCAQCRIVQTTVSVVAVSMGEARRGGSLPIQCAQRQRGVQVGAHCGSRRRGLERRDLRRGLVGRERPGHGVGGELLDRMSVLTSNFPLQSQLPEE
jgi:hypothetical protein